VLYNKDPVASHTSAAFTAPWEEGGPGKYAGKPIVIIGGSSSLGQNALQLAKLSGFYPVIATASLHNTAFLQSLGATHVFDRALPFDALRAEIAKVTSAPTELVYDTISLLKTQRLAYGLVAPGGTLLLVLEDVIPNDEKVAGREIKHANGFAHASINYETAKVLYSHLTSLLVEGMIKPNRPEVLPGGLHGVMIGLERLRNEQVSGVKLVVRPQETV